MKLLSLGIVGVIVLIGVGWLAANSRAATETPSYEVIRKDGDFEIRRYPTLSLAKAKMAPSESNNRPFGKLFRFISGDNQRQEKIAMTAPVLIDRDQAKGSMSFIIPQEVAAKGAPSPSAPDVTIDKLPASRFAAVRFGGNIDTRKESEALERLRQWVESQGMKAGEGALAAYYDPPWTPVFMRRNEILVPLIAE